MAVSSDSFMRNEYIAESEMAARSSRFPADRSEGLSLPSGVAGGSYKTSVPMIRPSKLASKRRGGIGKELSEGWCLNFAVGCTHGCPFCYVDAIHKRFGARYGKLTAKKWGDYFLMPSNFHTTVKEPALSDALVFPSCS